ncbi:MAG TPA: hypothetical protein VMT12_01870 [Syntrophales bacterium]|nr:hypothetical protein [Syntrophales bacterium]
MDQDKDKSKDAMFEWLAGGKYRSRSAYGISKMINDYRDHVKKQFVGKFEEELKNRVNKELGIEWSLYTDDNIFDKDQKFKISKSGWKDRYYIALSNEFGTFNGIYYGLYGWHKSDVEEEKALQARINEKFGPTRNVDETHDDYIWWRSVDVCSELRDNIDNIINLLEKNRDSVIDSWAGHLTGLARFVEPYIDQICKSSE